jgi:hypothetical protein
MGCNATRVHGGLKARHNWMQITIVPDMNSPPSRHS